MREPLTFALMVKYGVVGLLGTGLYAGPLALMVEVFAVHPTLGSGLSFCLSLGISYLLNYFWTFRSTQHHRVALARYVVTSVVGLGIATGGMHLVVEVLELHYGFGMVLAMVLVPLFNFGVNLLWTFGPARGAGQEPS